jgi:hypothetical protein
MTTPLKAILIAYALIAVVTYGPADAAHERWQAKRCAAMHLPTFDCEGIGPIAGMFAGLLWPLYWSEEAFTHDRG